MEAGELALVVIDDVHLVQPDDLQDNQRRNGSEVWRSLKTMARQLDNPVIVLSQLPRTLEARRNKYPRLFDFPDADVPDVVMFIYRDEYYHQESSERGMADIIVARHRRGPLGAIQLRFESSTSTFKNLDRSVYE
jgi:replicative DNA helicase